MFEGDAWLGPSAECGATDVGAASIVYPHITLMMGREGLAMRKGLWGSTPCRSWLLSSLGAQQTHVCRRWEQTRVLLRAQPVICGHHLSPTEGWRWQWEGREDAKGICHDSMKPSGVTFLQQDTFPSSPHSCGWTAREGCIPFS